MKKIIDHWCLYYVWILKYFEQKKHKEFAQGTAERLLLIPLLLYVMLYLVVPVVLVFASGNASSFMRNNRLLLMVIFGAVVLPGWRFFQRRPYVKEQLALLRNTENWRALGYYQKGKRIVVFHVVFTFLSVPVSFGIIVLLLKLIA
jgi:hypothetical protein